MMKVIALLKKKAGLSRAEFIAYYETRHAPLIRSLLPDIADYRRNYVDREGAIESSVAAIDFDSVTEIYFADRAACERFWERSADPEVARAIAEDEENVFDRAATRLFIVDETGGTGSVGAALGDLAAERAIREGLARFARVLDGKEWNALGDVFAADLTFNYGFAEEAGLAALTATIRRFLDVCGPSQHLIGSIAVTVDPGGLAATSRAYVQARHQRPDDPDGPVYDSNGEYVDRWACTASGWRITRRDAHWAALTGDPAILWGVAPEGG
jgi:SnoaL-like domain/EthD domain